VSLKVDIGSGHLSNEAMNIVFRERMWDMGLYIFLGLPNHTECTQEMDQGYQTFKPATDRSALRVAAMKMAKRVEARKKSKRNKEEVEPAKDDMSDNKTVDAAKNDKSENRSSDAVPPLPLIVPHEPLKGLEEYLIGNPDEDLNDNDEDAFTFELNKSVCVFHMTNNDLGAIVNGFPTDPIKLRPFDYIFMRENIWSWWCKVGFMPMNRNSLNDDKVRHELGDCGATEEKKEKIKMLVEDYAKAVMLMNKMGFNSKVLATKLEVAQPRDVADTNEKLIEELVETKGACAAGKLFKVGIHVANCSVVLEARRRMNNKQAAMSKEKEQHKLIEEDTKNKTAIEAFTKWVDAGKPLNTSTGKPLLPKGDSIAYLLPKFGPKELASRYNRGVKSIT